MALSNQSAVSDGTLTNLLLTIDYFERSEIIVLFDDVVAPNGTWAWVGVNDTAITFTPAVPNGVSVRIQRITNIDVPRHQFSDGAQFKATTLDENAVQLLHVAQELRELEGTTVSDVFNDVNMHGFGITNLADAVADGDALPYGQYKADINSAGTSATLAQAAAAAATAAADSILAYATVFLAFIANLLSSLGAGMVGYMATATYAAGTIGAHFRGRVNITDSPWNCVCDSNGTAGHGTDNTAGVAAAFAFGSTYGYPVYNPGGICRIGSGFTMSASYRNLILEGNGHIDAPFGGTAGESCYMLDSTDPASFFLDLTGTVSLTLRGVYFRCAQYVAERAFIRSSGGLYHHTVADCNFQKVEQPFVYMQGGYFQNANYRNVMFLNSGTFHSKGSTTPGSLIGTYMTLDNVNHEGTIPVNAAKVLCDLTGIRQIWGANFLLEGALPAAGWTVLKLQNPFDSYYTRASFGQIVNFHSEWGGFTPAFTVMQVGGTFKFSYLVGPTSVSPYHVTSSGKAIIEEASFSGELTDSGTNAYTLEDNKCVVQFDSCSARTLDMTKAGYIQRNMQYASSTNGSGQVVMSNDQAQQVYRWDGAIFDGDQATLGLFGGTTNVYSTDAVYGRKFTLTPSAGSMNASVTVKTASMLVPSDQIVVACRARMPTYTGGLWAFDLNVAGVGSFRQYLDTSKSGQYVDILLPYVLLTTPANIGIGFSSGTATGVSGDLEILSVVVYHGNAVPRRQLPCYAKNTISYASAMPTTGTWKRGDQVINNNPAVGSARGWTRITTGSGNVLATDWATQGVL